MVHHIDKFAAGSLQSEHQPNFKLYVVEGASALCLSVADPKQRRYVYDAARMAIRGISLTSAFQEEHNLAYYQLGLISGLRVIVSLEGPDEHRQRQYTIDPPTSDQQIKLAANEARDLVWSIERGVLSHVQKSNRGWKPVAHMSDSELARVNYEQLRWATRTRSIACLLDDGRGLPAAIRYQAGEYYREEDSGQVVVVTGSSRPPILPGLDWGLVNQETGNSGEVGL